MASRTPSILEHYPDYALNIGIEVHVQLSTKSKIFCGCENGPTEQPNAHICQVCAGHPGVLPVLNNEVLNRAILAGLATNCSIAPVSTFARKHYFYPDLPKNYQTTQDDKPICSEGYVMIRKEDGTLKKIRIKRIHMEEDAGKNIHSAATPESFVDLNRTGTPLLEIVTYPDIESTEEAKLYLQTLHTTMLYLGISTCDMEDGAFRADTNISVRKKKATEMGTRCELKNINSFKFIGDAIEYEIERQIELLEQGEKIVQETRLWDTKNKRSFSMRSKEDAADYRYFEDPDLPVIKVSAEVLASVKEQLPELPFEKFDRFTASFGLSAYEADILVDNKELAQFFEETYKLWPSKSAANWILRDIMRLLKEEKIAIADCKIKPAHIAELVQLTEQGKINSRAAQETFGFMAQSGKMPVDLVKEHGLEQIGSSEELDNLVKEIIQAHPDVVADYKAGKERAFGFFVGTAMKQSKGKADPKILQELIKKYLA
jgi:aspartyl-tRNA(Asn)/glutamyl-tRNA(Gln) amidotransferase subunit B